MIYFQCKMLFMSDDIIILVNGGFEDVVFVVRLVKHSWNWYQKLRFGEIEILSQIASSKRAPHSPRLKRHIWCCWSHNYTSNRQLSEGFGAALLDFASIRSPISLFRMSRIWHRRLPAMRVFATFASLSNSKRFGKGSPLLKTLILTEKPFDLISGSFRRLSLEKSQWI